MQIRTASWGRFIYRRGWPQTQRENARRTVQLRPLRTRAAASLTYLQCLPSIALRRRHQIVAVVQCQRPRRQVSHGAPRWGKSLVEEPTGNLSHSSERPVHSDDFSFVVLFSTFDAMKHSISTETDKNIQEELGRALSSRARVLSTSTACSIDHLSSAVASIRRFSSHVTGSQQRSELGDTVRASHQNPRGGARILAHPRSVGGIPCWGAERLGKCLRIGCASELVKESHPVR